MAAPATVDEFLDLVRKSGVVDEGRLSQHLQTLTAHTAMPATTNELAARFIRDGLLTQFQARQILLGKWRRFLIGGKYKLLELLGAGGMGAVYLCEHIFMRRLVALKVLPSDKISDPSMVERFYREARATAALDHPNIVRSFDIDQFDGLHFLVMEYIEGSSMHDIIARHGPLSPLRAAHYMAQTAYGLQHAHQAGLVHRDIKPGNLLIDRTGTVKILDLGLARFFDNKADNVTEKYDERTVLGTADYLAPEQAVQSKVDIRADIYSLGATFYFLLAGRAPFQDGSVAQKLVWHQMKQPEPLTTYRSDLPEGLQHVIERMMAKQPDQRYQEPADVVEALAPWTAMPIAPPESKEMPRLSPAILAFSRPSGSGEIAQASITRQVASPNPRTTPVRSAVAMATAPVSGLEAGRSTPLPRNLTQASLEGPPETMALPRPGSDEERSLLQSVDQWKTGRTANDVVSHPRWQLRTMLLVGGGVLGGLGLLGGLLFVSGMSSSSQANTPSPRTPVAAAALPKFPSAPTQPTAPPTSDAPDPDQPISPEAAGRYVGQVCTVEFGVLSTGTNGKLLFINSKKSGPNAKSNFTVVLTEEYLARSGKSINEIREMCKVIDAKPEDVPTMKVRAKGEIILYRDKPEIKVSDPSLVQFEPIPQPK
jgi:serine/threonine protein kinase